ncbi:MAG: YceI family protein [Bacteroidales bacterium]|nr:YceI family protein [Bacteroidales bacterium]
MKTLTSILTAITLLLAVNSTHAQRYVTKNGNITFFSETPVENIRAVNKSVNSALDTETGQFVFKVLMKSFQFKKALMQEDFNENYVESDQYPNSTFQGNVVNHKDIDFDKPGTYEATVKGDLTIHGVTNQIKETGTFKVVDKETIKGNSTFTIKVEDYDIKIPKIVSEKIAEEIEIKVDVTLKKLKK